jgi:hypothetical protein
MRLMNKNAEKWNIFALSILALAIAVFAWGLGSKLSLYRSAAPTASHSPVAKLLSNRERPADMVVQVERATTPLLVAVAFSMSACLLLLDDLKAHSIWTRARVDNPLRRQPPLARRQVFLRPPPSRPLL